MCRRKYLRSDSTAQPHKSGVGVAEHRTAPNRCSPADTAVPEEYSAVLTVPAEYSAVLTVPDEYSAVLTVPEEYSAVLTVLAALAAVVRALYVGSLHRGRG